MKQVVLVVSFGTSYNESRVKTIEAIEKTIKDYFSGYELRQAYTSHIIREILEKRDGIHIDSVRAAMLKLVEEKVSHVLVQPTHVISGEEYDTMMKDITPFENQFEKITFGKPLLASEEDYEELVKIIVDEMKVYDIEGTEILLMGHGTEHKANIAYKKLAQAFKVAGLERYHIGTVEAEPSFEELLEQVKRTDSNRVVLMPLMIVAGDHANNDMAGTNQNSWKSRLEAEGYEVICLLKGLGELLGVRQMFVKHAARAESQFGKLKG